jgi:CubicO group peptidase (beta-lactamase class C family)
MIRGFLFCLSCTVAWQIVQASPYDDAFDVVMTQYRLPGLAVGVIENGEIAYRRTAGETVVGSGDPITAETLFKIASNSKVMTASVLARLVDSGKVRWGDPVIRFLPQFRMYDPWVTQNMQVQDLLVHNSGLPEGGGDLMLWPEPNYFTRDDIIAGLAFIKPAYSFRSGYAYDNLLYVVAGEVAAAAGGLTYEELVRQEIFEPLGLECRVGEWQRGDDSVAQPHGLVDDQLVVVAADDTVVPVITSAAAGGIRCNLQDMLAWAMNWLAPTADQQSWLSVEQRREMWMPRTPMPISDRSRAWNNTHYYSYAFGFRVADIEGTWTVSHTGSLMGMYSVMYLLPDSGSGFVIMTNGQGSDARTVMTEVLLHRLITPKRQMTAEFYIAELSSGSAKAGTEDELNTGSRALASIEEMAAHAGIWRDPWFGDVSLCDFDGRMRFESAKSPMLAGTVMRATNGLLIDWDHESVDAEAWLTFDSDSNGNSPAMLMAKVDPLADFSFDYEDLRFTRVRDCNP